jgi:hypothetical protein
MKYTLTRANPDADQYPLQDRQIVTDPLEEEVNKSVMMTHPLNREYLHQSLTLDLYHSCLNSKCLL